MSREPSVPLTAFNQMNNNLMRLIEQESQARRDHEERMAQLFASFAEKIATEIAEAMRPPYTPEPSTDPVHMSEDEEDLRYGHAIGRIDDDQFKDALAELRFHMSGASIEEY